MDITSVKIGQTIKHIKSGVEYSYFGTLKAKIDGCWVEMHSYFNSECELYSRHAHDFDGFELV